MTKYRVIEANQRKMLSVMGYCDNYIFQQFTVEEFQLLRDTLRERLPFLNKINETDFNITRVPLRSILALKRALKRELERADSSELRELNAKIVVFDSYIKKVSKKEVFKDKIRARFLLTPGASIIQIRNQVYGDEPAHGTETADYYYTQGDFSGGSYAQILNMQSPSYSQKKTLANSPNPYDLVLSFGYINDEGVSCGVSICKCDQDNPRYFFVHTHNCNASELEDRMQTVIYDENYFTALEIAEPDIDAPAMLLNGNVVEEGAEAQQQTTPGKQQAFELLLGKLKSRNASDFVKSVFTEDGTLVLEKMLRAERILRNMMSCDPKIENELLAFYQSFIDKYNIINAKKLEFDDYYDDNFVALLTKFIEQMPLKDQKQALCDAFLFIETSLDRNHIANLDAFNEKCFEVYDCYLSLQNASDASEKSRLDKKQAKIAIAKEKVITELVEISRLQAVIDKAKAKALNASTILNFDPQGRLLLEIDDSIVSLDVGFDDNLSQKYLDDLSKKLGEHASRDVIIQTLKDLPSKNSIICLQQEMYFHLSLVLNIYKKQFTQLNAHNISEDTMQKVNTLVMQEFANALIKAYNPETNQLKLDILNAHLDSKRIEIAEKAHNYLLQELDDTYTVDLNTFDFAKAQEDAKQTTATNKNILHVDRHLNTLTEIDSHILASGSDFPHSAVKTYRMGQDLQVHYKLHSRQMSTLSLPVTKGLSEQESIQDKSRKIAQLASDDSLAKPFTYNLLTAMQHRYDDLFTNNAQTKNAKHIMLGAHVYNRQVLNKKQENYCLIQAISVNGFGRSLGYQDFGLNIRVPNEATLLAEMTLCYNMGVPNILEKYKDFLKPPVENTIWERIKSFFRSPYFVSSQYGKELRQNISNLKKRWRTESFICNDQTDNTDLVRASLKKIMAYDLHFSHDYAKLIQALSIVIEDESIVGCTSGNERTSIIMGREQLLNKKDMPKELRQAFINVTSAQDKKSTKTALNELKKQINKYYNEENLYGANALNTLAEQGAGHQIAAKNGYEFDSNKAEDQQSEGITNLIQTNTRVLQVNHELPNFMRDAVNRHKEERKKSDELSVKQERSSSYAGITQGLGVKSVDFPNAKAPGKPSLPLEEPIVTLPLEEPIVTLVHEHDESSPAAVTHAP